LYWENLSAIVIDGKRKKCAREADGRLKLDRQADREGKDYYKPILIDVEPDDDDYATMQELKYGAKITHPETYEVTPLTLYKFVASEFLKDLEQPLERYLGYIDYWYNGNQLVNEARINYQTNIRRIELLKELESIPETDPFSFFEGAFTGHNIAQWVRALKRLGYLDKSYKRNWHDTDLRVLGIKKSDILGRLVTSEIRDILSNLKNKESQQNRRSYFL